MSLGSQRGGSCGTVLPALSKVFMSVCFLPASLPSSLSCCSELQKELGTVPASISSKQHIQVSAESVYRPQIYCGPVAVGKSTSKAMKCAPVFNQGTHPSALPGSWGIWGVTAASLLSAQSLIQMDSGALTARSGVCPRTFCLWQGR